MRTAKPKTPVKEFEGTVRNLNNEIDALNKKIEYRDKQLDNVRNVLLHEREIKEGLILFLVVKDLFNEWSDWFARYAISSMLEKMKD